MNSLKEIEEIAKENGILYKGALFACFDSNIFTYKIKTDNLYHEFCIICEDTLLDEMPVIDLFRLKRISFFGYRIFDTSNNKSQQIASYRYAPVLDARKN